jgi:16S rRNA (adenine1518-N6/adenine1519-N6)-dimethyltransferase
MNRVQAKKRLGQHFLTDNNIARKIVNSLSETTPTVLEIGPGMGILTQFLLPKFDNNFFVVEIDPEAVNYLRNHYPVLDGKIIADDFLKMNLQTLFPDRFSLIGNFPYNISSQILFRVIECKNQIPEVVGMFQKEVALRIASSPGTKQYGILSVLLQAFYNVEYLFTVDPHVFTPPPKVQSAVIRLERNAVFALECDEQKFKSLVKTAFNHRRKTLRNSLKTISFTNGFTQEAIFDKRPEQLSVAEFISLTNEIVSF